MNGLPTFTCTSSAIVLQGFSIDAKYIDIRYILMQVNCFVDRFINNFDSSRPGTH